MDKLCADYQMVVQPELRGMSAGALCPLVLGLMKQVGAALLCLLAVDGCVFICAAGSLVE